MFRLHNLPSLAVASAAVAASQTQSVFEIWFLRCSRLRVYQQSLIHRERPGSCSMTTLLCYLQLKGFVFIRYRETTIVRVRRNKGWFFKVYLRGLFLPGGLYLESLTELLTGLTLLVPSCLAISSFRWTPLPKAAFDFGAT